MDESGGLSIPCKAPKARFFILLDKGFSMKSHKGSHIPWILQQLGDCLSNKFGFAPVTLIA